MATVTTRLPTARKTGVSALNASRVLLVGITAYFVVARFDAVPTPSYETQLVIYLLGMTLLNLPHGGYEHFLNTRRRGFGFGARYVAVYLVFVVGFVALFFVEPVAGLVLAFATASAKGGGADVSVVDVFLDEAYLRGRGRRALAGFVRGGAVMILPFIFWEANFMEYSYHMTNIFEQGAIASVTPYVGTAQTVLGSVYAVALVAHVALGLRSAGVSYEWLVDTAETVLLVAYFVFVPVIVAIGLYFPFWYSLRQMGRSVEVDDGERVLSSRRAVASLSALWLATVAVAAGMYFVFPNPLAGAGLLAGSVAFFTVFVCIIALPHVVVGSWMDDERGIWNAP